MIAVATCALCGSVRWRTRESIDRFRVVHVMDVDETHAQNSSTEPRACPRWRDPRSCRCLSPPLLL